MKLLVKKALSLVPTRLPVGLTEFEKFADDIIELTGPIADKESMRYVIATNVINLGPQRSHVAKNYFVRTMIKGAANQVASHVFQEIKQRQIELQQKAQAEATAALEAAANGKTEEKNEN
jgi:hypothetical protein